MNLSNKLSILTEKFTDFISGLDNDFEQIKKSASDISFDSTTDLIESYKQLQVTSEEVYLAIKKNRDDSSSRKASIQQELSTASNNNTSSLNSDLANQLRNYTQKSNLLFESNYNESISRQFKPEIGNLWLDSKELVNQITESHLAESHRSNEIQLTLKSEIVDSILNDLKQRLKNLADNDIEVLNSNISTIQSEVKRQLELKSIKGFNEIEPIFDFAAKLNEILKSSIRIETPFQGSCPKLDFRSIIIEMRSYSIMFILLVSTFHLNKSDNEFINTSIVLISAILIVIGALATYTKIQDTRTDKRIDELKKAKEKTTNEIKRGVSDFLNDWRNIVLSSLKTTINDISSEIERTIKEDTAKKQEMSLIEKARLSKELAEVDMLDRKYQEAFRKCESIKTQIDLFKHEIQLAL